MRVLQFDALRALFWWCGVAAAAGATNSVSRRPNIVMIIADDLGWNDVGLHGSNQIPTPNIDALGYNGIIFNRHYTQQTCTPSRAALLTGQYPIRTGMQGFPMRAGEPRALPPTVPTLPERMQRLGYATHLVGKWHLGYGHKNETPTGRGYRSHFGYWNGYVGYFDYEISQDNMNGYDLHDDLAPYWEGRGRYATDLFTERAVDVIGRHDRSEPLFLVVSHLAPHTGKYGTEMEVPDEHECNEKYGYVVDDNRRRFVDIVNRLDRSVGTIVKALSNRKILNDTVVIFFSDNGAQTEGLHENFGSNWPLRGLKFTLFEGGVRNVAVAWSARFKHKSRVNDEYFHISDWLPTLYESAGGNANDLQQLDGVSQWRTLTDGAKGQRTEMLLNIDEAYSTEGIIGENMRYKLLRGSFNGGVYDDYYGDTGREANNPGYDVSAVLNSDVHKAIASLDPNVKLSEDTVLLLRKRVNLDGCRTTEQQTATNCSDVCLFDLLDDPCETTDLSTTRPDVVDRLNARLSQFRGELVPQTNAPVDPASNPKFHRNVWSPWLDDKVYAPINAICSA